MIASSSASASVTSSTTIGTSCRPARCDARQRRSPAMISKRLAAIRRRAHHDRLNDAALADRLRQFVELGIGEDATRIARIRREILDRHFARRQLLRALRDRQIRRRHRPSARQDHVPAAIENHLPCRLLLTFAPPVPPILFTFSLSSVGAINARPARARAGSLRSRAADRRRCRRISDRRPAPACHRTALPKCAHCAG